MLSVFRKKAKGTVKAGTPPVCLIPDHLWGQIKFENSLTTRFRYNPVVRPLDQGGANICAAYAFRAAMLTEFYVTTRIVPHKDDYHLDVDVSIEIEYPKGYNISLSPDGYLQGGKDQVVMQTRKGHIAKMSDFCLADVDRKKISAELETGPVIAEIKLDRSEYSAYCGRNEAAATVDPLFVRGNTVDRESDGVHVLLIVGVGTCPQGEFYLCLNSIGNRGNNGSGYLLLSKEYVLYRVYKFKLSRSFAL